ncbi:MAG: helix-turn-helix domain-containing protein [Candidatus Thalassarchaeaceae archaeon]|jgi:sugar-specific transcriptional regulator TrmB/predicted hydrocarbon binding protein|nr:helix-turn-helix domain-containing protein [Candidatus Thalassarchaeaceae archaeon]
MSEGGATLNERLTDIGLDEKEASVIILLATSEPLKASAVGRMVGISRMDSYNTLKRLQERGLVMSTLDKPMRFTGLEIEEVFQQLINHEEQELRRIKTHLDEFKEGQKRVTRHEKTPQKDAIFTVVKERSYIHAAMERVIDDSETSVWLVLGKFGILHLVKTGALRATNDAAARGVSIRILATLEKMTMKYFEQLDERIEIRHSDSISMHGCIIDGEVAVQNVAIEKNPVGRGKEDAALVIEAPSFLSTQTELIESAWNNATPISTAKILVERGENTQPLHINLGAGSFYRRFKEIIARDVEDQHPDNEGWTNAILRHGEPILTPQPNLPEFELLGLNVTDLMRIVGKRIGEEIAFEIDNNASSDVEFWGLLSEEWKDMGMGEMEIIGNPPSSIIVHDAGACGKAPQFGSPFCHLDEGILEGIIEEKFGISKIAVDRTCSDEGNTPCFFEILIDQLNT